MGVPPFALVDDLVCIYVFGINSIKVNAFINAKPNLKKLQFGVSKCHKMHVGSKRTFCPELRVDSWEVKQSEDVQTGEKVLIDKFFGAKRMDSSEN